MSFDLDQKIMNSHRTALKKALPLNLAVAVMDDCYQVSSNTDKSKSYKVVLEPDTGLINSSCECTLFGQAACIHRVSAFMHWLLHQDEKGVIEQVTGRLEKGQEYLMGFPEYLQEEGKPVSEEYKEAETFWLSLLHHYELICDTLRSVKEYRLVQSSKV